MRKVIAISTAILILIALSLVYSRNLNNSKYSTSSPLKENQNIDIKASFLIYTNGTKRDFGFERYYNQSKNVYIDSSSPTTIQVKKRGTTWADFFSTLPMKLTDSCLTTGTGQIFCTNEDMQLKFYINGVLSPNFLQTEIKNNDQALIHYGSSSEEQIESELAEIPQP